MFTLDCHLVIPMTSLLALTTQPSVRGFKTGIPRAATISKALCRHQPVFNQVPAHLTGQPMSAISARKRLFHCRAQLDNRSSFVERGSTSSYKGRDLRRVLEVAESAARQAGEIMSTSTGEVGILKYKANAKDIVTEKDIACQEVILNAVKDAFPSDRFLGEESVSPGSEASAAAFDESLRDIQDSDAFLWIVDPIDGTTNFQSGLPLFSASIGVVSSNADVVAAVVYNPILDEMTSAILGHGCYVNGEKLDGGCGNSKCINLGEALINVGFPVSTEGTLMASSRAIKALSTKVKGLRMIASASQVMAWVAQKKLNAYVSWDLNSWDVCAGMLLVEEAGGFVSNFEGKRATIESRDLIVSCEGACSCVDMDGNVMNGFHMDLLHLLAKNDCLKY